MAYNGTVTAEVNGLESGSTLDLQINNNETLSVTSNGKSSFRTPLPVNSSYSVSLKDNQPPGFQWCAITNGSGTVTDSSNIVAVGCTSASGEVTTISGRSGAPGSNNATLIDATFNTPRGLVFDSRGNLYVNDAGNMVIRKIDTLGVVSTFAGVMGQAGTTDGPLGIGKLGADTYYGFTIDKEDNFYLADGNNTIRKIDINGTISTIAGVAGASGYRDGPALNALFDGLTGIAVDSSGNLFVSDIWNSIIRKIDTNGQVSTFAGIQDTNYNDPVDGAPGVARLGLPTSMIIDENDILYLADRAAGIRKIDRAGNVTTLTSNADGFYTDATSIVKDRWGNFYTGGAGNNFKSYIIKFSPSGSGSILAGSPLGRGSTDGIGGSARFNDITGLAIDSAGNLLTTESGNHLIRKIVPAAP